MTILTEGGLRVGRYGFVPEQGNQGTTPDSPEFEPITNRIVNFEPELGPEQVDRPAVGEFVADVEEGPEENAATLEYEFNRWLFDENGDPQDLAVYGIERISNALLDSVSLVERMESGEASENVVLKPESTMEHEYRDDPDATGKASRVYTVLKGVDVEAPTLNGQIEDVIWTVEADLACEEGRSYQIDQPHTETALTITWGGPDGSDDSDDGLTLVIEDEGAASREELTLEPDVDTGDREATTTTTFDDVDAVEVRDANGEAVADHMTDIVVEFAAEEYAGEICTVLYGRATYNNTHGDGGVPTLGDSGSWPSTDAAGKPIARDPYRAANQRVMRPDGEPIEAAGSVQGTEIEFSNEVERTPRQRSRSMRQHHAMLEPTATITYDSETGSHRNLVSRMTGDEEDLVIAFDRAGEEKLTLPRSKVSESGRSREAGSVGGDQEVTIRGQEPAEISSAAQ